MVNGNSIRIRPGYEGHIMPTGLVRDPIALANVQRDSSLIAWERILLAYPSRFSKIYLCPSLPETYS